MPTLNKVILIGHLGRDPEVKTTASGLVVTNVSMATQDRKTTTAEWHNVTVFGSTAEFVGANAKKGDLAYVEGTIKTEQWEDKNGNKRETKKIICNTFLLLGGKSKGQSKQDDEDVPF